ncbi:MAG: protocatechuate 3,4-dioxygenase subunit alpha [Gammaproteobacteria bacterium]|nr:protocatechuate 3,4-dioxygenase subunit alpha [Gammaproteobacteria bacterium]
MLHETASQTAGPYLHIGLAPLAAGIEIRLDETWNVLVKPDTQGDRIRIEGIIYDGNGAPVKDAMVEIWQANAQGKYNHPEDTQEKALDPSFQGFGRAVADFETGLWSFETIKPGPVEGRHGTQMAPHVNVSVFARGIGIHLNTRIYFDDEPDANERDPVLRLIDQPERRETLLARRESRDGATVFRFDIHLQGDNETVFFDV